MKCKKIYLICPVRNCTQKQAAEMLYYVSQLERIGHAVHFPPRDVDQSNDDGGVRICEEHAQAMLEADEVHVWWEPDSKGSHFDFGMAFVLSEFKEIEFVIANPHEIPPQKEKDFVNLLMSVSGMKHCGRCKLLQNLDSFNKNSYGLDGLQNSCRICNKKYCADPVVQQRQKLYGKNWRIENAPEIRVRQAIKKYDVSEQEARRLYGQTFCDLCGKNFGPRTRNKHIDHCHETGRIRGVLCMKCNTSLGQLGDTEQSLLKVLKYLKENTNGNGRSTNEDE